MIVQIRDPDRKQAVARAILEALPDWFGVPESIERYVAQSRNQPFFAAMEGGGPVGFLCLKETGSATVELCVMGVLKEYHRRGVGRRLFEAARAEARARGYSFMQVKTVQMGCYPDYDDTNRFYISLGFREFEVFPTLWDEANPCQVYVMSLQDRGDPMDKKALRRAVSEKKRALTGAQIEERSRILADRLFATEVYREAESLYAYLSFNQEVRTAPIIERAWADGKRVAVPKVVGRDMVFIWLERFDPLRECRFGIPEPVEDGPVADDPGALVLMPGLVFDREGHRVGYGGGFYDRFLAREPGHPTLALCYDFQLVDSLETEAHDVPVGQIVTDG